jgi:hypothetical protein
MAFKCMVKLLVYEPLLIVRSKLQATSVRAPVLFLFGHKLLCQLMGKIEVELSVGGVITRTILEFDVKIRIFFSKIFFVCTLLSLCKSASYWYMIILAHYFFRRFFYVYSFKINLSTIKFTCVWARHRKLMIAYLRCFLIRRKRVQVVRVEGCYK